MIPLVILPCVHVSLFSEGLFIPKCTLIFLCNYTSWWNLVLFLYLLLFLNLLWCFILLNTFRRQFLLLLKLFLEHNLSQSHFSNRFIAQWFSHQFLFFALFFTVLLRILRICIAVTCIVSLIAFFFELLAQVAELCRTFLKTALFSTT